MDPKCLICVLLHRNLKMLLSYLKSVPSNLSDFKFSSKIKILKFETKNALFGYFWTWISKQYFHIWNHQTRICLVARFREKMKMPKFGIKNALLGYFWARISKSYCYIWNQHQLNFSNYKILQKNKNAKIWDQKPLIWVFLG